MHKERTEKYLVMSHWEQRRIKIQFTYKWLSILQQKHVFIAVRYRTCGEDAGGELSEWRSMQAGGAAGIQTKDRAFEHP